MVFKLDLEKNIELYGVFASCKPQILCDTGYNQSYLDSNYYGSNRVDG